MPGRPGGDRLARRPDVHRGLTQRDAGAVGGALEVVSGDVGGLMPLVDLAASTGHAHGRVSVDRRSGGRPHPGVGRRDVRAGADGSAPLGRLSNGAVRGAGSPAAAPVVSSMAPAFRASIRAPRSSSSLRSNTWRALTNMSPSSSSMWCSTFSCITLALAPHDSSSTEQVRQLAHAGRRRRDAPRTLRGRCRPPSGAP